MKKLIAALTLLLAFSINANAQDKKSVTSSEKGKKEAAELTEYLGLDQTMSENFFRLFEQKNSILEDKSISQERKTELARVIEAKIRATLDAKQMDKLDKNPALLKKLTN
jgi:hypothetical protein